MSEAPPEGAKDDNTREVMQGMARTLDEFLQQIFEPEPVHE